MFFRTYTTASSSQMEAALAKKDVTLRELMDEEDIINECKLQNKALMEFLVKPDVIEELITLTTVEPSPDIEECTRFKYSNIACEILTCDVPSINERLASDQALLSKLCAFIDCEPPLNPLLASFFSKIMGVLFAKKAVQNWLSYEMTCLQVLDFLKAKENFISLLLRHLGTSAIMDLTLKLMTQVEGEVRENNLKWLNSQQVMQSLVSLLDPSVDSERHYNVAQLLCDFIKTSRESLKTAFKENYPNPLLDTLESPETISLLIDHMLGEDKVESCIVGGIQVLLLLLELFEYGHEDFPPRIGRYNTIVAITNRLGDFQLLLLDPPKKQPITTTFGLLDPPLGNTRLQITKLFATLISTQNYEVLPKLIKLGTFNVLLDLFFQFPWNNFLHTQVESCINFALTPAPFADADIEALYEDLVLNCKLPERILEAWKQNNQKTEDKNVRQGYMGHLMNIANLLNENVVNDILKDKFPELAESFSTFTQTTLKEVINMRSTVLGGEIPHYSDEEVDEFGDAVYPNELQEQSFARYQLNNFVPQLMDKYEFNDDFNDTDTMQTIMDHRMNMNFDLSEGITVQPQELFKQVCAQNISTLDDADQIFEDFMNTLDPGQILEDIMNNSTAEKQVDNNFGTYNVDSEEEDDSPPVDEDDAFLRLDGQLAGNSESAVAPISMGNVWSNNEKTAADADNIGWANFSSASFDNFEANFENATDDAQRAVATDIKVENLKLNSNEPDYFDSKGFAQMLKEALSPLASSIESPLKDIPESEIQHTNKELRSAEKKDVDNRSSPNVPTHEPDDKLREQHGDI
ncbi:hypothetical protein PPYR_10980 [Photinus pyralis]|uniref:Uncharacterized protein n=1 Tax=Photinus pyralis TaxID=7054 RepID=A0A5N4AHZ7_PHOPY|nr:serine/threonine-protein phosphatase 6 regulatory subunit 3 [Photinus pyralis]KAB0796919.1 hypothetical protein PPYR_10980 [Photinus pyralis]